MDCPEPAPPAQHLAQHDRTLQQDAAPILHLLLTLRPQRAPRGSVMSQPVGSTEEAEECRLRCEL